LLSSPSRRYEDAIDPDEPAAELDGADVDGAAPVLAVPEVPVDFIAFARTKKLPAEPAAPAVPAVPVAPGVDVGAIALR